MYPCGQGCATVMCGRGCEMSRSWLYILGLMLAGSLVVDMYPLLVVSMGVNLVILVGSYLILRRDPYADVRGSMLFIVGLVGINMLAAVGVLSGMMANLAFIALLVWSMAGGGRSR